MSAGKQDSPARVHLFRRVLILPFVLAIRLYQATLSPFIGGQCRFTPSCSHYAIESYRDHGVVRGTFLTARRILRCHPFGGSGYDPVPLTRATLQREKTRGKRTGCDTTGTSAPDGSSAGSDRV